MSHLCDSFAVGVGAMKDPQARATSIPPAKSAGVIARESGQPSNHGRRRYDAALPHLHGVLDRPLSRAMTAVG
jgi:hypothetical protein